MNTNHIITDDRNLLGLAVKCRLISIDQEKEILSALIEEKEKIPDTTIVHVFKDRKYLSEEEINFLFAVKDHLKMKMLDKKFGELGIANKFVNSEKVTAALNLQSKIFKQTQKSKLIGDILIEQNEITKADKTSILLTQDRIEDEFLAEALNDIASTQMEKISINMRFGAVAVKKEYITLDQLNKAISIQKIEQKNGKPKSYLGEILKKHFDLSTKDITSILKTQKEFEKQRLSLEKTLSLYQQGKHIHKQLNKAFEYRFSKNKFKAYITIKTKLSDSISVPDFIDWLKSIGLIFGICNDEKIKKFLKEGSKNSEILIAEGKPPLNPVDESIEFFFNTQVDSKSQKLKQVNKDDILARITPHQKGKPGKDVCGFKIAPPVHKNITLSCGEGIVKKNTLFISEIEGKPVLFKNRTLFVMPGRKSYPTEYLSEHIRKDFGIQYQNVNLNIGGNIEPDGKIVCNNVVVKGDVRGQLRAAGSAQIEGNAINSSDDPVKFPCIVSSDEDVFISKKIFNMIVITSKSLIAPKSDLTASKVYAFQDIVLNNVHSKEGNASILQIGINPHLKEKSIDHSMAEKSRELEQLSHVKELKDLVGWYDGKAETQNKYLRQHKTLQELLLILDDIKYYSFATIDQKIVNLIKQSKSKQDPRYSELLDVNGTNTYLNEVKKEMNQLSDEKQKPHLKEQLDIKYGMYKASVNATRRYKTEYTAEKNIILKKIKNVQPQINELIKSIQDLSVKKDFLKMQAEKKLLIVAPTIQVKNMVEKGTIIKGKETNLIVDQNIYGVKFSEKMDKNGKLRIVIEGYYD